MKFAIDSRMLNIITSFAVCESRNCIFAKFER